MDIVLDANILFSILIKQGISEVILLSKKVRVFAPEFIFEEFNKYKSLILEKTQRSEADFLQLLEILKKRIILIPNWQTEEYIEQSRSISPGPKDTEYIALALKLKCPIWSNDKELKKKQKIAKVYSTEEIIEIFKS